MIGRSDELAALRRLMEQVSEGGQAVIIQGEAGIGKTSLVSEAVTLAVDAGFRELRCTGVQSETTAGFAGLHELLYPVLDLAHTLPVRQQAALSAAFGSEGPEPDRLLISLAVLGLLEEVSSRQRVIVVVEDLQWLDPSTAEIISFVARRLANAPILLVVAARTTDAHNADGLLPSVPLTRICLDPLSDEESSQLLDALPVRLTDEARRRVLKEAAGHPLALQEFATAVDANVRRESIRLSDRLPTTRRLEHAFLGTAASLPPGSRQILLLAAAAHDVALGELFAAGSLLGLTPEDLDPVERARLVAISGERLTFRHPLVRSAVYGAATTSERARAHEALGAVASDSTRAAWHRAAASYGHNEQVAAELEEAANRARGRGAQLEAVAALHRAAVLSPDVDARARRLATAAELARRAGATATATELVDEALPLTARASILAELIVTQLLLSKTAGTPCPPIDNFIDVARQLGGPGGDEHRQEQIAVLWCAAVECYGQAQPGDVRQAVEAALLDLDTGAPDPDLLMALALLDPARWTARVRPQLPELTATLSQNVLGLQSLALAAETVQDVPMAFRSWSMAAELARRTGFPNDECQALRGRANTGLVLGQLMPALEDIERALSMVEDLALPSTAAAVTAIAARVMAWEGNLADATAVLARSREMSARAPLALARADQAWAGGLIALAEQRYRGAWTELAHVTAHPVTALWAVADLTEAAVHSDRRDEVAGVIDAAERDAAELGSSHLAMLVHRSRALLADDAGAEEHFCAAISVGQTADTPLELARTRLLYGEWLRRRRRQIQAREQLGAALHVFESAGARPFAERAAAELRAAGVVPARAGHSAPCDSVAQLTPQELQIARLAARGLTNKEIADQVYLSHRTVSAHLYKVFPKLGITSRAQLRDALP